MGSKALTLSHIPWGRSNNLSLFFSPLFFYCIQSLFFHTPPQFCSTLPGDLATTIIWTQPLKAGPARTSSDPPDCPPTLLSHTPSQSLTTTRTPAPPRPIGCREDGSRQEEMKRVGVTVFKELGVASGG